MSTFFFQITCAALAVAVVCCAGEPTSPQPHEKRSPDSKQLRVVPQPEDSPFLGVAKAEPYVIPHEEFVPSVYDAVMACDATLLHELLNAGLPAAGTSRDQDTPLCAALRLGREDMAIDLLLHGADPQSKGAKGEPAVALASLRRHPLMLRMLLAAGANPDVGFGKEISSSTLALVSDADLRGYLKREQGMTPLMICAHRGDVENVALLLAYGASTQIHTKSHNRYAIEFAAEHGYLYVMRLLLGRKPESEPHVLITVNLSHQRARLQIDGETKMTTSISTGREGYATPAGRYVITNKYREWNSTIYKVPMPYFLRLNCSPIGLHSGYVTGRPASHGCIRLPHEMAVQFYKLTRVGDEVIIED